MTNHSKFCCRHGIQSKRPIVKTSHSQKVPYSKRPQLKRPIFEAKRPRRSKRPKSKRTDVRLVTECAVVIYTDRDCEVYEVFKVREITIFFEV